MCVALHIQICQCAKALLASTLAASKGQSLWAALQCMRAASCMRIDAAQQTCMSAAQQQRIPPGWHCTALHSDTHAVHVWTCLPQKCELHLSIRCNRAAPSHSARYLLWKRLCSDLASATHSRKRKRRASSTLHHACHACVNRRCKRFAQHRACMFRTCLHQSACACHDFRTRCCWCRACALHSCSRSDLRFSQCRHQALKQACSKPAQTGRTVVLVQSCCMARVNELRTMDGWQELQHGIFA